MAAGFRPPVWRVLTAALALRLALVVYGEWQDAHLEVRYTDVDYLVFSDAAALVAAGRSPFDRSTYRYSPLLAFLLLPNSLHPAWGKILFSAADLLVGLFIGTILRLRGVPDNVRVWCMASWFFNPFTFTIGTRGNCEPIVCSIILWIVICLMNGKTIQAALWYGLIVHFRIYPIIYALPFVIVLSEQRGSLSEKPILVPWSFTHSRHARANIESEEHHLRRSPWLHLKKLVNKRTIVFGLLSGSIFVSLTALFFLVYGWDFLNEAFLYHLTRTDPRHNFSAYFYYIYLHHQEGFSVAQKLTSFLPQLMVQFALVTRFAKDLPFCFLTQTIAFVAFNKVMTAQYFVWFFCLLPVVLPWSRMRLRGRGLICIAVWAQAQIHWLMWAYQLEFKGRNVFLPLWGASLLFLAANTFVLLMMIYHHRYAPLFVSSSKGEKIE